MKVSIKGEECSYASATPRSRTPGAKALLEERRGQEIRAEVRLCRAISRRRAEGPVAQPLILSDMKKLLMSPTSPLALPVRGIYVAASIINRRSWFLALNRGTVKNIKINRNSNRSRGNLKIKALLTTKEPVLVGGMYRET